MARRQRPSDPQEQLIALHQLECAYVFSDEDMSGGMVHKAGLMKALGAAKRGLNRASECPCVDAPSDARGFREALVRRFRCFRVSGL